MVRSFRSCLLLATALAPLLARPLAAQVPLTVGSTVPKLAIAPAAASRCAVIGVPLAKGWKVPQIDGRPTLGLTGTSRFQFTALETWSNGGARWVLARAIVPGTAAAANDLWLVPGLGSSGQPSLATWQADGDVQVDTGVLYAEVRRSFNFNVLDRVVVDGLELVKHATSPGLVARTMSGELLAVAPGAQITIVENGPAFALLKVTGTLRNAAGAGVIDFTCRLGFTWGSPDVEVTLTVRNASILRPQHTSLRSLEMVLKLATTGTQTARVAVPAGETQTTLGASDTLHAYQAYSSAFTEEVLGSGTAWLPPIPKTDSSTFAQEGYVVRRNETVLFSGNKDTWPAHEWLDLSGSAGGCTVAIQHMPNFWPASLEATGDGLIDAALFTPRNNVGYTWSWRQHESRTAVFSFHKGPAAAPVETSRRLEAPVAGRVTWPLYYELVGAFPYDLLTLAQQNQAYALMGLPHSVDISNLWLTVTRFLPSGATGGENNHDYVERLLASEFLRMGGGGQYQTALDLALWKSESQILRSDDFLHADDPGATNDSVPHTSNIGGDDEHRYRGGLVLAWRLTGDERYRDALKDELEILPTLDIWPHERSMYQSLVALVEVADCLKAQATLAPIVRQRLDYFCNPVLDVEDGESGFGWDGPPTVGPRGCYVYSEQNKSEKLPGENYVTRGFISASMGPRAMYRAALFLGAGDPLAELGLSRLRDMARYTRSELFPWFGNPSDRRLVYSYGVMQEHVNSWEVSDFHPILLGMAEAWRQTGDIAYLEKGIEQIEAFASHDNMEWVDKRLEAQHFLRAVLDAAQAGGFP